MLWSERILLMFANEKYARKYDLLNKIQSPFYALKSVDCDFSLFQNSHNHLTDNLISVYIAETFRIYINKVRRKILFHKSSSLGQ